MSKGLIPIAFVFMLYGIVMTFGYQTGAAINTALDLSGRVFAAIIYGSDVFRYVTFILRHVNILTIQLHVLGPKNTM